MPTVQVPAPLSPELLLEAAEQLDAADLDRFAAAVVALRGRRRAESLSPGEAGLLAELNDGHAEVDWGRYRELLGRRDAETLSDEEHAELLTLTDEVEQWEARRVELVAELADLRGTTLDEQWRQLGLRPASHE